MSVYDIVKDLSECSLDRSKKYNEGDQNYAFAFGWFVSEMQANLDNMGLTKKQLKVLEDRIQTLKKISEKQ